MTRVAGSPHTRMAASSLRQSRVLVIGAGGLGAPAAAYLVAAGVGTVSIVDPDRVALSNLHRQLLHHTGDIGRAKVASATESLRALRRSATIEPVHDSLDARNAKHLIVSHDFVIDGSDNFETKFLINDAAVSEATPFSHAGVTGWLGQTMTVLPGRSACYRCVFGSPPPRGEIPSCQEAGIVGSVAGLIGVMQAAQAVTFLTGQAGLLCDCMLTYDALQTRWRAVRLHPNPRCPIDCGTSRGNRRGIPDTNPSACRVARARSGPSTRLTDRNDV